MSIAVPSSREALADAYVARGSLFSLHTASPGTTGANEATGGSPAYTRESTTWSADAVDDGTRVGTQVFFDVPAGSYTHWGFWNDAGTVFLDGGLLSATVTRASQGQVKVTPSYTQS